MILKLLSHSAVFVCRLDDLAVDSDEEVDYSKMDQVTADHSIPSCYASLKLQKHLEAVAAFFWLQQGALLFTHA